MRNIAKMIAFISILLIIANYSSSVLAAGNCAFSAGKGGNGADMSATTKQAASTYGSMGYNSYYAVDSANCDTLSGYFSNGTKRLESDIVFLTGHGSYYTLSTLPTAGINKYGSVEGRWIGTETINWSNVKLAIFLACQTGAMDAECLAYDIFQKSGWKTVSMGWRQDITANSADKWSRNFNAKLKTGATVEVALNYANSQNYTNNSVKDISFYGDPQRTFGTRRSAIYSDNEINEDNITYITSKNFYYDGTEDTTKNLINAIKSINNEFEVDDYEMKKYILSEEQQYYTIDFMYKKNNFYTNSGYTLVVKDNFVKQIADNTIRKEENDITFMNKEIEINEEIINEAKDLAKIEILNKNENAVLREKSDIEVREQTTTLYEDLNSNKKYIQVFTAWGYVGSQERACEEYMYEL